ncbi:MAG: hypothetical protein OEV44_12300 [Spirochaetota bacterium]|nr:hypothetical protein [Spirochaetota bacterium]
MKNIVSFTMIIFFVFFQLDFIFTTNIKKIYLNENEIKNFDMELIDRFAKRKDPFLAGIISTIMPGIGQIYSEEYTKGSLIILGDTLGKTAIITMIINYTNKYSSNSNNSVGWEELNGSDKALLISIGIIYLGFYIWNINDAVESAKIYNAKSFREPSLYFTLKPSHNEFQLGIKALF